MVTALLSILLLSNYSNPGMADESYMLYCHKITGECYSSENDPKSSIEYFGSRDIREYETLFLNVKPPLNINAELTEKELEQFYPAEEGVLSIIIAKDKLKLFKQVEMYPNGRKKAEYTGYGHSKEFIQYKHGKITQWYENGKKEKEIDAKYGVADGKGISWYENGIKHEESEFSNDKKHGVSKLYDEHGRLRYKDTYKVGEKINRKAYSEEGRLLFDQDY